MKTAERDLTHDLVLPTLLFATLGGMTWAVRGCSGYGSSAGCIFAGVMWGVGWWFLAREPGGERLRRYSSGWIVLAVTVGVGIAGNRGWMQWPHFFDGRLNTNWEKGEWVPISRTYGFVWLFLAGVPWAGIGACMLAWCGSLRETRAWHWAIRLACGIGGALLLQGLYLQYPQYFLPLYETLEPQYNDLAQNPTLKRMINDCREGMLHMGFYLGLLAYEIGRLEWKNVTLISSVGFLNGCGWALFQNWKWAPRLWPEGKFNWWRCWESSGGISIGVALGIAYFLTNRKMSAPELAIVRSRRALSGPNFEWLLTFLGITALFTFFMFEFTGTWGLIQKAPIAELSGFMKNYPELWGPILMAPVAVFAPAYYFARRRAYASEPVGPNPAAGDSTLERFAVYLGLLFGLGISIRAGLKGWFNLYRISDDHPEKYWNGLLWNLCGPLMIVVFLAICWQALFRPLPRDVRGDRVPKAYGLIWLVLIVQNILGQLVTGPLTSWNEVAFSIYYLLLFAITAVIVLHYEFRTVTGEAMNRLKA